MMQKIVNEIKSTLKDYVPSLSEDQKIKQYKARNPDNPNYIFYGIKMKDLESIAKTIHDKYTCSYDKACEIFKQLIKSDVAEEKFAALYFLNCFKKNFNKTTIDLFYDEYSNYCNTWALCDSTCLKVLGPFLNKSGNSELAKSTIEKWSKSNSLWIKRASVVILLKLVMLNKDFYVSKSYVFNLVEKMLQSKEDYIQKSIGWLLKTCSKSNQQDIVVYLDTLIPKGSYFYIPQLDKLYDILADYKSENGSLMYMAIS
ncbi:MAG: DNA alkylation repair protein, partial [Candidatus Hermodarchaeota archaeon]